MNKREFLATALTGAAASMAGCSAPGNGGNATSGMVKLVVTLHRRPGMEYDDFSRYWREVHAPIAAALPGLRKYVQNYVSAAVDGSPRPYDAYAELWFDDMDALQQAFSSPEGQAATADNKNFMDEGRLQAFVVEEVAVV
jgi:uncharacterized protein (TIGR02118 family)